MGLAMGGLVVTILLAATATPAALAFRRVTTIDTCCVGPDGAFAAALALRGADVLVGGPGQVLGVAALFDGRRGGRLRVLEAPQPSREFGRAVAAGGRRLYVGAPDLGKVFAWDGRSGLPRPAIDDPAPSATPAADAFGSVLATGAGLLLVGAPFDDADGLDAGVVYAYDVRSGTLRLTLRSPAPRPGGTFGHALAVGSGLILVGEPGLGTPADSGIVYAFDRHTGTVRWAQPTPTPGTRRFHGFALAADRAVVAVGAPCRDEQIDAGLAHVLDAETGVLQRSVTAPEPEACDFFGGAVAVSGDTLVVGAPLAGTPDVGAAHVYAVRTGAVLASFGDGEDEATVGTTVAIGRGRIAIGAAGEEGQVHVYAPGR